MIDRTDLLKIARARLRDAQVLFKEKRFDGAMYICGYAVECALKARIASTLKWKGFPETGKEFQGFASLKTHDLEILLAFSGREQKIRTKHLAEWSGVMSWDSQARYRRIGLAPKQDVLLMIRSSDVLLKVI